MRRKVAVSVLFIALHALGAAAQIRGPSRPGPSGSRPDIVLTEKDGCGPGPYLTSNMQDCVVDAVMSSNGTLSIGFSVSSQAAKKHGVLLTLRSVGGAAVMRVFPPGMGMYSGRVVYFNDAVTESILRVPAGDLEGGDYTAVIQGMGGATRNVLLYLRVQTPPANVRLAASEKAAMQAIWRSCCPVTKGLEAPDVCSTFLPNAFKATKAEDDLCNMMGFVCNSKGQLEKIDFSNAGLKCKKFPPQFGEFPELETLMLRFNSFNGDSFENVAEVLSTATNLRRLMMGNTNITGRIPCRLFEEHTLKTVMFSVNPLEGDIPECLLAHTSLEELYMSRLPLTGKLPDSIPEDSSLVVWYAINRDPMTGRPAGPGFSGELPKSLSNAKKLAFMEMSGHQLSGGVPALPENIRMFEVQHNQLNGGVTSPLPSSLIYFDISNNSLVGPLPDFTSAKDLALLDLSQNELTGTLPSDFGAAGEKLVYLDMSRNRIGGSINQGSAWDRMPALQYLFLHANELEGSLPASLGANKKLVAINTAYNRLSGNLDAFAEAIPPPRTSTPQQDTTSPASTTRPTGRPMMPAGQMGRKLATFTYPAAAAVAVAADPAVASLALGKKLLGTREDWSILQPGQEVLQYYTLDTESLQQLATGQAASAGRRLMQAVTSTPAAGPPSDPDPPTPTVEPTPPASSSGSSSSGPISSSSSGPMSSGTMRNGPPSSRPSMPIISPMGPPRGRPMPDMAFIAPPSRSALAGNSFLYFNVSNNDIEGAIPESLGNLEMFRSPANSTDAFDMFVFSRGGPDRTMDLTYNKLYGEFPQFLVKQAPDLPDSCLCTTNFTVSAGNQLYCPTKDSVSGVQMTPNLLDTFKQAGYTCLMPNQKDPVLLASYLANPSGYISSVPSQSELPAPEEKPRSADSPSYSRSSSSSGSGGSSGSRSGGSGGKSGLGPGEIAGAVVGSIAGAGILAALAYFVGYKKFYKTHQATTYKRGEIPDGPMLDGVGAYPAAAYGGAGAGPTNGSHFNPDAMPVSSVQPGGRA